MIFRFQKCAALIGLAIGAGGGAGLSALILSTVGACNTGIFAAPTNPGTVICECTCAAPVDADAGEPCLFNCEGPFNSAEDVARQEGCGDEFEAYTKCLVNEGTCTNRSYDAPSCGEAQAALSRCEAAGKPGG
jgi:hypothetical protein